MRPDEPCVHERDATGPLARFFYNTGLPCVECEREAHDAWLETVRAKLAAGLEAAARGETYDWNPAPDDGGRFALLRLDDRIDLALTVGQDGRCTVPVKGLYSFGRVTTLREAVDAEARKPTRVLRPPIVNITMGAPAAPGPGFGPAHVQAAYERGRRQGRYEMGG